MRKLSIFVFAIFIFCAGFIITGCDEKPAVSGAPEISAAKWFNSNGVKLADLKDKLVVVEFWATWCPPCRASIPHLEKLHNEFKDKGVVIISLSDEAPSVVEAFMKKAKMSWIIGAGSKSGSAYGVQGIPHAYLIKDGKILWHDHPMKGLDKAIKANLTSKVAKTEASASPKEEVKTEAIASPKEEVTTETIASPKEEVKTEASVSPKEEAKIEASPSTKEEVKTEASPSSQEETKEEGCETKSSCSSCSGCDE